MAMLKGQQMKKSETIPLLIKNAWDSAYTMRLHENEPAHSLQSIMEAPMATRERQLKRALAMLLTGMEALVTEREALIQRFDVVMSELLPKQGRRDISRNHAIMNAQQLLPVQPQWAG